MKKLLALIIIPATIFSEGCTTDKTRSVEAKGCFVSNSGQCAIGSVDVVASPDGAESAVIKYEEDNAWLQPSMKLHGIKIHLTGTNSVSKADGIVKSICEALVETKKTAKE